MRYIKHLYPKDERFMRVLSISGNIRSSDANKIDISDSRLKNYEKEKLIEKVTYPSKSFHQQSSNVSYALTKKGKEFISKQYGITRCQNSHAVEHNCKVAELICNLDKKEIDSVQPEWQTRDQMEELLDNMRNEGDYSRYDEYMELWKEGKISAPDIVYVSTTTNTIECIEVITGNYKESDIESKEVASQILEVQIEYVNV